MIGFLFLNPWLNAIYITKRRTIGTSTAGGVRQAVHATFDVLVLCQFHVAECHLAFGLPPLV